MDIEWQICLRPCTVDSEIFAIILFSQIVLKDILATLEIRNLGMIYRYQ